MRLSCLQEQNFLLGVFHSISDEPELIQKFILSVIEEFIKIYSEIHNSLRVDIDKIVDEKVKDCDKLVNSCCFFKMKKLNLMSFIL